MTLHDLFNKQRAIRTHKRHSDEEHRLQVACVRWFRYRHPELHYRLFAVPNGSRRDAVTGAKLKEEGVLAGVADLILLKPNRFYGALLIEMKTPKGRPSDTQKEWAANLQGEYKYVICRSINDFIREVEDYLKYE